MIFLRRAGCQSRMIFGRAIIPLRFLFVRDLFRKPVPTFRDHALVSRFRSSHHCAAHSFANFGIKGTLAIYDSSAVFGFEVPTQTRGYNDRNFKSTALVPFCHTVNALGAPRDVTAPQPPVRGSISSRPSPSNASSTTGRRGAMVNNQGHSLSCTGAASRARTRALIRSGQALSTMIVVPQIGLPLLLE